MEGGERRAMRPACGPGRLLEIRTGVPSIIVPGPFHRRLQELRHWISSCPGFKLTFCPFTLYGGEAAREFFRIWQLAFLRQFSRVMSCCFGSSQTTARPAVHVGRAYRSGSDRSVGAAGRGRLHAQQGNFASTSQFTSGNRPPPLAPRFRTQG